ncbi:MAG: YceI family protein [Bacteroidota bacterium]
MAVTGFLNVEAGDSYASFKIKKLGMLTIEGTISGFDGEIFLDLENMEDSYFDVGVTPVTIKTGNLKRDEHLRSTDFFYVRKYPIIFFKSKSVQAINEMIHITGTLQMLKTTLEVRIPMKYKNGLFTGSFSLNRKHYGLGKKFPPFVIGNNIDITINCLTTKRPI